MKRPVILVSRGDDNFSSTLRDSGYEVVNLELIKTAPLADLSEPDKTLARIQEYDGLFFTSPAAAEIFVERSKLAGNAFGGKVYVLGERARTILENAGFDVAYRGAANTAGGLIASFDELEFAGKRLLFVRGDKSLGTIPNLLRKIAVVDEVVVYETKKIGPGKRVSQEIKGRLKSRSIDWICFFSPSGVRSFCGLFGSELFENVKTA